MVEFMRLNSGWRKERIELFPVDFIHQKLVVDDDGISPEIFECSHLHQFLKEVQDFYRLHSLKFAVLDERARVDDREIVISMRRSQ